MKRAAKHEITPLLDDQSIGLEARVSSDDHHSLRLWLRLLACSTDIETEIRKRLRAQFSMTLARFDYLAQLHRHPDGLRMSALSRFLMVTGGNVTGLTDELEKEGLVQRDAEPDPQPRHIDPHDLELPLLEGDSLAVATLRRRGQQHGTAGEEGAPQ